MSARLARFSAFMILALAAGPVAASAQAGDVKPNTKTTPPPATKTVAPTTTKPAATTAKAPETKTPAPAVNKTVPQPKTQAPVQQGKAPVTSPAPQQKTAAPPTTPQKTVAPTPQKTVAPTQQKTVAPPTSQQKTVNPPATQPKTVNPPATQQKTAQSQARPNAAQNKTAPPPAAQQQKRTTTTPTPTNKAAQQTKSAPPRTTTTPPAGAAAPGSAAGRAGAPATPPRDSTSVVPSVMMREVFDYNSDGRRDPFISLLTTTDLRPTLSDLKLLMTVVDEPGRSVALVQDAYDKANPQKTLRVGTRLGRMRVSSIRADVVVFTIEEFGSNRRDSLMLRDPSKTGVGR
jgi:hypothetical protein